MEQDRLGETGGRGMKRENAIMANQAQSRRRRAVEREMFSSLPTPPLATNPRESSRIKPFAGAGFLVAAGTANSRAWGADGTPDVRINPKNKGIQGKSRVSRAANYLLPGPAALNSIARRTRSGKSVWIKSMPQSIAC